jgi:hypothetical protein
MSMSKVLVLSIGLSLLAMESVAEETTSNQPLSVMDFGAVPDGYTDNTAAFTKALKAVAAGGGGIVHVPTGRYSFSGSIVFPKETALHGTASYAPSHAGIRDRNKEKPEYKTVFLVRSGANNKSAAPFIQLNTNCALRGVCIYYPEQMVDKPEPITYPFAIQMRGNNPAVIDVELLNPYDGIDASNNQRAIIRNVHGQPLHMGIFVDGIYDIGRIENVHWNPWWSLNTPIYEWQRKNGVGFSFGKSDWHYVVNTFCFGYHVGYKFFEGERGPMNGNFLGIGADACHTAVLVEQSLPWAILITNGEFVAMHGDDPNMIVIKDTHQGTVRFVNCAFWGPCNQNAVIEGTGTVGFSDCTFMHWGRHQKEGTFYSIDARGGSVLVRGCDFKEDKAQIRLGPNIKRAIISENLIRGENRIVDQSSGNVVIRDNLSDNPSQK